MVYPSTSGRTTDPWDNGYCKNFNSKLRDKLLNAVPCSTLYEAEALIER